MNKRIKEQDLKELKYINPKNVTYTISGTKAPIKIIKVIDNGKKGGYSIAIIESRGIKRLAFRWNGDNNIGFPTNSGGAAWCELPFSSDSDNFINSITKGYNSIK